AEGDPELVAGLERVEPGAGAVGRHGQRELLPALRLDDERVAGAVVEEAHERRRHLLVRGGRRRSGNEEEREQDHERSLSWARFRVRAFSLGFGSPGFIEVAATVSRSGAGSRLRRRPGAGRADYDPHFASLALAPRTLEAARVDAAARMEYALLIRVVVPRRVKGKPVRIRRGRATVIRQLSAG